MLKKLLSLFEPRPAAAEPAAVDALPLAVAALLVEAACADDRYDDDERALIGEILAAQFNLAPTEAAALRKEGEQAQAEAFDIHRFTKIAKNMEPAEKTALIERLWEIVLSDGERDPHEDALVRRVCGLIYVSDPESGAARARVAARLSSRP
ncbi:MAG: TerB family tellurite resistance protein [Parvularculaceae bacterium]